MATRIKAEQISQLIKMITWKKERKIHKFTIALYGNDSSLLSNLEIIEKRPVVFAKEFDAKQIHSLDSIDGVHMLIVAHDVVGEINEIIEAIKKKNILLVTDSCPFNPHLMINYNTAKVMAPIEINEKNIKKAGFKISPLLYMLTTEYKADWQEMFNQSEELLKAEQDKVDKQREILKKQEQLIEKRKQEVNKLIEEADKQKAELQISQQELEENQKSLSRLAAKTRYQQQDLLQKEQEVKDKQGLLVLKEKEIESKNKEIDEQLAVLKNQNDKITKQKEAIEIQQEELVQGVKQIKKQQLIIYFFVFAGFIVLLMVFVLYRNFKIKKQANIKLQEKNTEILQQKEEIETQRDNLEALNKELEQQKEEITAQRDEIEAQRDEIEAQRDLADEQRRQIEIKQKETIDSINYASRIQTAVLPNINILKNNLVDFFVLFKPRDIVSGDFYWFAKSQDKLIIAAADCTGHGVPGAFMSLMGIRFLNNIVVESGIIQPHEILNHLRAKIIEALHQSGDSNEHKDGMDITMISLDLKTNHCMFSGANSPLYIIPFKNRDIENSKTHANNDKLLIEIKPDRMPVGTHDNMKQSFALNEFSLEKGDMLYMFSDGYPDQFGGATKYGKKLKSKAFKNLLLQHSSKDLNSQSDELSNFFEDWRGSKEQVDDILVIGVKV